MASTDSKHFIQQFIDTQQRAKNSVKQSFYETYDISEKNGFVPTNCADCLPSEFECFQIVRDNLQEKDCDNFREIVALLPEYNNELHSIKKLSLAQCKYMYSFLLMVLNRWVWCTGVSDAKLYNRPPKIIGIPLYLVSKRLQIVPSMTHAAVNLWNNKIIFNSDGTFDLDKIQIINTMTGDESENWFYMIHIAIEASGGRMLWKMSQIHKYFNENPSESIKFLKKMSDNLKLSTGFIKRMHEGCDPDFFFNRLRIYLSGSENDNLPEGIILDLSDIGEPDLVLKYAGGSAAQSTLIQVYDALLGVKHSPKINEYLVNIRNYMPQSHRNYLEMMIKLPSLPEIVDKNNKELVAELTNCVQQLERFRMSHMGLIHSYIMRFVGKPVETDSNAHGEKGSGGTNPVEFCNDTIEMTKKLKNKLEENNKNVNIVNHDGKNMSYILMLVLMMLLIWQ